MNIIRLSGESCSLQAETPGDSPERPEGTQLAVNVIYTNPAGTSAALEEAVALASDLKRRIRLLAAHVVSIRCPVDVPPVSRSFLERRLLDLAEQGIQGRIETSISLYLCRDPRLALLQAIEPRSLVVVGCSRRWWPWREESLARALRSKAHQVVLVNPRHGGDNVGSLLSRDRHPVFHSVLGLHQGL